MNKIHITFGILFSFVINILPQSFPVNEIIVNGDRDKRINIVFLGDGYTIGEMHKFTGDVQGVVTELFKSEPYNTYKNYFNVYSIEVPSEESGSTHPGTANDEPAGLEIFSSNTYFGSTYDFAGIHRLLVIQNYTATNSVLASNFPDWDIVFIIVNHHYYGGSGGTYATTSTNESSFEVAIHELGHSFARLADEYDYGSQNGFEAPNATAATKFENIKWNKWIHQSTPLPTPETGDYTDVIGLFEGAVYNTKGWFRPKLNCKMNSLFVPFCEVCSEQTVLSIYNYLNTIDTFSPKESVQNIPFNSSKEFSVETIDPLAKRISVNWYWDNEITAENTKSFLLNTSNVSEGTYKLKAVAKDNTELVRKDEHNLLTSEFEWTVIVGNTTSAGDNVLKFNYSLQQNYPNPFNPSTKIKYSLKDAGHATLIVYDLFGREVKRLVDSYKAAGNYEIEFNALELASGIYFYQLSSGKFRGVKKLMLLK